MANRRVVQRYPYYDLDGTLLFYHVRYEPKTFGYENPRVPKNVKYKEGEKHPRYQKPDDAESVLYQLPKVFEARTAAADIWWCAGEKDADNVQKLLRRGEVATTVHGGESKPLDNEACWLAAHPGLIYIVGDLDEAGYRHMLDRYDALVAEGFPAERIQLRLPQMTKPKSDVSDHLEAKLGLKDLRTISYKKLSAKLDELGEKRERAKAERQSNARGQKRLEEFIAALREHGRTKGSGEDWSCPHPDHEDDNPSFGVKIGAKGSNLVLYCQVCCADFDGAEDEPQRKHDWMEEVLAELGLTWAAIDDVVEKLEIPGNDTEAAEWLLERHGEDLRWLDVGTSSKSVWLHWDGSRWRPDADGLVRRWMVELSRELVPKATARRDKMRGVKGEIGPANDDLKAAKALGNKGRIDAALAMAQILRPGMTIQRGVFDADKRALAVENGVLLLESNRARLVPPDRSYYMLRNTNVPYVAGAVSQAWEEFLNKFVQDEDMEDFLQRMAGYTLLGENPDNLMFIFQGETGSGKTTFTKAISGALGDYAKPFELGALRGKLSADAPREDIASIMHARLAHSAEMTGAFMLHADQVKRLSGADEIPYRHLFEGMTSHVPDFTAWISSNFPPKIKGADKALQIRLIGVPFLYPTPEGKSNKANALFTREARQAILSWVVAGYERYCEVGLGPAAQENGDGGWPGPVAELTAKLRSSLDVVDDFINDCCEVGAECFQPATDFWAAFEDWKLSHGVKDDMSSHQFAVQLDGKHYRLKAKRIEGKLVKCRMGIRLLDSAGIKRVR